MDKLLNYKGYHGSVDFDLTDQILYGKILHINDLITYEAENIVQLKIEFQAAVDDYLDTCQELGKSPDKACSGSFNVRTTQAIHKQLSTIAVSKGENLNTIANQAFSAFIDSVNVEKTQPTTVIVQIQHQGSLSTADQTGEAMHWNTASTTTGQVFEDQFSVLQ